MVFSVVTANTFESKKNLKSSYPTKKYLNIFIGINDTNLLEHDH